jgi:macrolide transport system ATP-binding/permease protein
MGWLIQTFTPCRRYSELSESIREHLDEKIEDLIEDGMSRDEATRAAHQDFGDVSLVEECSREVWQWPLEWIWPDLRYAIRQFKQSPSFAIAVVFTLALGIGANISIFTLAHAILIKSLPVGDPKSLYRVGDKYDCCAISGLPNREGDFDLFSYKLYKHLRQSTPEFEQLAAMDAEEEPPLNVRRGKSAAKTEPYELVSGNYFAMFGIGAFAGRMFTDVDDREGVAPVAVMSYQAWQSDYASDPSVVGSIFYLQGQPVKVIGISPPGFFGDRVSAESPAFWMPLATVPLIKKSFPFLRLSDQNWLYLLGRVRSKVDVITLQQNISVTLREWLITQSAYTHDLGSTLIPKQHVVLTDGGAGIQSLQQQTRKQLYLLLALSGLVLLIACANVANLLLAQLAEREADSFKRMALGATRSRLIQRMLTESMLLGCLGGVLGLPGAYVGARAILALAFPDSPYSAIHATPSLSVLGFTFLVSLCSGVAFGFIPAWFTCYSDPTKVRIAANRFIENRVSLPQKSLIVFQSVLSLVLLVGAGLLARSLWNMEHQNFGVQIRNRYVLHLNPAEAGYKPAELNALNQTLKQRFEAIPGMHEVGLAGYSPLDGNSWGLGVAIDGKSRPAPKDEIEVLFNRVGPDFFTAVGQQIIQGRGFTQDDTANSSAVAVVNEAFVKKFFPGERAIGQRFGQNYGTETAGTYEIVGVVTDTKYILPREKAEPMFFRPLAQWEHQMKSSSAISVESASHYITSVVMNFSGSPQDLDAIARRTLSGVNSNLAVLDLHTLDFQLASNFNQERLAAWLTGFFGLLSLALTSVGIYCVTSNQAVQSRKSAQHTELGKGGRNVFGSVARNASSSVGLGLIFGIPAALVGAHYIADQLFVVQPYDPINLTAAILALSAAAVLATVVSLRRELSADSMQMPRGD